MMFIIIVSTIVITRVCVYTCIHAYIYIYTYMCMGTHTYIYIYVSLSLSISLSLYIHIYIHTCISRYTCTYIYIYTYVYAFPYIDTYVHIYIYICICISIFVLFVPCNATILPTPGTIRPRSGMRPTLEELVAEVVEQVPPTHQCCSKARAASRAAGPPLRATPQGACTASHRRGL